MAFLQDRFHLDRRLMPPLASRLKLMAGCDITERRRPQDWLVSLYPSRPGPLMCAFPVCPPSTARRLPCACSAPCAACPIPLLEELDFSKANLAALKQIVGSPNGVFFVTGPTGSGKTTTLYALLKLLNRPSVNILTVEDPVEDRLPGINQVQVNPNADLTFLTALRTFLRQDPNIILIGEVRDMETAKMVTQAALTGQLVMTTLHTNNAIQAITRLIEIGVEPWSLRLSLASALSASCAGSAPPAARKP